MWASRLKAIHLLLITGAGEPVNGVDPGLPPPPSSSSLLLPPPPTTTTHHTGPNDFQLLVTGGIYINSWTAPVSARLQVASAKKERKKKNAKGAPETKKSDTSDSNPPWSIHLLHPPPAPPVPNSFRLLWLRAGGFTQCCSLPAAQTDTDQRLKYGSTFLTDKDRWKVSLQYNKQNLMR